MKLSEFENEKALDVLADIMEPAAKILTDKDVRDDYESGKPKILMIKNILKKHKKEVVQILATLNDETPDTYEFNLISLTKDLLELANDEELAVVFQWQGQTMQGESFGPVTENIMEKET